MNISSLFRNRLRRSSCPPFFRTFSSPSRRPASPTATSHLPSRRQRRSSYTNEQAAAGERGKSDGYEALELALAALESTSRGVQETAGVERPFDHFLSFRRNSGGAQTCPGCGSKDVENAHIRDCVLVRRSPMSAVFRLECSSSRAFRGRYTCTMEP